MKEDSDLDPIRNKKEYIEFSGLTDIKEFNILAQRFRSGYFQYYDNFMYNSNMQVLNVY